MVNLVNYVYSLEIKNAYCLLTSSNYEPLIIKVRAVSS